MTKFKTLIVTIFYLGISFNVYANNTSCKNKIGENDSEVLVNWCIEVSPATHPPCHSSNSCDLIVNEIQRGCEMLQHENPPHYCLITYNKTAD